ncbi:CDP-alcohol phosphatidyltransferase family protein, partial [Klebsiella pneumoniae]|nr:CDP-alcohol phosphatidyltransferase family protein [Klebsiella pneumoniae]
MRLIGAGTRADIDYVVTDRFWTVPNVITLVRFCLVPFFVWLVFTQQYLAAFIVLAVLSCTDWVDGYIARRFNQISTVGQWLDPMADR